MKPEYKEWIDNRIKTYADAYGYCDKIVSEMILAFPELRRAYGRTFDGLWGPRWHAWCVTPDGEIVDPTVSQFPDHLGGYKEIAETQLPVGVCANCGEEYYTYYDGTVCDESCGNAFLRSLMES